MAFSNPIIGGGGALIRDSIQSPDSATGAAGWATKRDGSAEFNNVAIRGSLSTGPAGTDHIEIPAGLAEVDFVLGANGATARARTAQLGAGANARAGIDLESSPYPDPTTTFQERSVIHLRGRDGGGQINLGFARNDNGVDVSSGIEIVDQGGSGDYVWLKHRDSAGNDTGGSLILGSAGFTLSAELSAFVAGITGNSLGIAASGKFPTDVNISPSIAASANWTLSQLDVRVWGPFVQVSVLATRTVAVLAAGVVNVPVGTLSFAADTAFPVIVVAGAAYSNANVAISNITPTGLITMLWNAAGMGVGAAIRLNFSYYKG